MIKYLLYSFLIILLFVKCKSETEETKKNKGNWTTKNSIEMQKTFAQEEEDEIDLFLKRHSDWKMTKTGTGLRYFIYEKSNLKDTAKIYDEVTVDFEIKLLDGTICYTSENKGSESFMIEKTDVESGLHEALKYMCTNDKALFILPSHLAHGLLGDSDKIPPLVPVIFDIHLLKINKNNEN